MNEALFSPNLRERLAAAAALGTDQRASHLEGLAATAAYKPWPFGMPTSINPMVVVLGVSPGASPAAGNEGNLTRTSYPPPTFAEPHPGLYYPDTNNYWAKIRRMSAAIVRSWEPTLSETEALALVGHLNLGTGSFGTATTATAAISQMRLLALRLRKDRSARVLGTTDRDGRAMEPTSAWVGHQKCTSCGRVYDYEGIAITGPENVN